MTGIAKDGYGVKPLTHRPDMISAPIPGIALGLVWKLPFAFGDKVNIDDHPDIQATVTGLALYPHNAVVQVEWFANGDVKSAWFDVDRLKKIEV